MSTWTPELKEEVIARYQEEISQYEEADRGNHSVSICEILAKEFDKTVNGVRMILNKADVYIKKPDAATRSSAAKSGGGTRVSKAQAQADLVAQIEAFDADLVDSDIIDKMSGKACQYFVGLLQKMAG